MVWLIFLFFVWIGFVFVSLHHPKKRDGENRERGETKASNKVIQKKKKLNALKWNIHRDYEIGSVCFVVHIPRFALMTFIIKIRNTNKCCSVWFFYPLTHSMSVCLFFFVLVQRPLVNVRSRPRLPIPGDDEDPYSIAGNNCNISNENSDSSGYSGSSNSNGKNWIKK